MDAEFDGDFIFAIRNDLTPRSEQVAGRHRRHKRPREGNGSAKKGGAMLTCLPKCPHYLDSEFDGNFISVVRHDRIRALTKPWAV